MGKILCISGIIRNNCIVKTAPRRFKQLAPCIRLCCMFLPSRLFFTRRDPRAYCHTARVPGYFTDVQMHHKYASFLGFSSLHRLNHDTVQYARPSPLFFCIRPHARTRTNMLQQQHTSNVYRPHARTRTMPLIVKITPSNPQFISIKHMNI